MTQLVDYHMHTTRCRHATGPMEEYVRTARARGLVEIGFADHLPFPKPGRAPFNMARAELPHYADEIEVLRQRYPGLPIRLGIEADFFPECSATLRELIGMLPFDYVIGSVHHLEAAPGDVRLLTQLRFWDFLDGTNATTIEREIRRVVTTYHARLRASAESGLFHVIAHCDLPKRFGHLMPADLSAEYERTAATFARTGVVIELNTSGLRSPVGEIYPGLEFLRRLRAAGVGITLGSDAHRPEHVGEAFDAAVAWARRAGYEALHVWAAPGRFEPVVLD
jgi:histidinol-phosphatase (PHP family)